MTCHQYGISALVSQKSFRGNFINPINSVDFIRIKVSHARYLFFLLHHHTRITTMMIITSPLATQPAMIYFILLSFSVGNTRVVAVVIGGVEDVAVVVSAKSVCTLEMLALRALEMLSREL